MSLALCGSEELAFSRGVISHGSEQMKSVMKEYQEALPGTSDNAARSLIGTSMTEFAIKEEKLKPSDLIAEGRSIGRALVKKGAPELLDIYERKLNYCGCLPDGSVQMLDRMVSSDPEE